MTLVWPGKPYPLGATWDGQGVNFALFSQHATGVELCLFDSADDEAMKVRTAGGRLVESSKAIPLDQAAGEWVAACIEVTLKRFWTEIHAHWDAPWI